MSACLEEGQFEVALANVITQLFYSATVVYLGGDEDAEPLRQSQRQRSLETVSALEGPPELQHLMARILHRKGAPVKPWLSR